MEDGYDIHHIDFNRSNNNIKNLVSLPKRVHADYHKTLNQLNDVVYNGKKIPCKKLIKLNDAFKAMQQEVDSHIATRDSLIKSRP